MSNGWCLTYESFDPAHQGVREALTTLGNGYFCTRGAFEWAQADDIHYPGTYLAGGYNRLVTPMAGQEVENEDLVNLPNWLALTFRIGAGDWFNLPACEVLDYRRTLDVRRGVLEIDLRVRDRQQRVTRLQSRRIVSMADPHLAGIEMTLTAENWSDAVTIRSSLDGRLINAGVKRYRQLNSTHLVPRHAVSVAPSGLDQEVLLLVTQTNQSKLRIAQAARTRLFRDGDRLAPSRRCESETGCIEEHLTCEVQSGRPVVIEKIASLHTARDIAIASPDLAARQAVALAPGFPELLAAHEAAWARLWRRCDMVVDGHEHTQMGLRVHIFHLLQTLSPNSVDLDIGVPARGWHGEAYRGHVFWDEVFILPFLDLRLPALSRAMLRYRHQRLGAARRAAAQAGLRGALFPWQSGSDGREETQSLHLNPRSGRWLPDHSHQQRHVGLAIAYNVWRYYTTTGERSFLVLRGAELLVEIARAFAALAHRDPATGRYHIHGVMGPDEYHEAYPQAETPGLNDNAYTNVLTAWLMDTAERALQAIDAGHRAELIDRLHLSAAERALWADMARRMFVPFQDGGIVSQFAGYEALEEFDWQGYRQRYGDIQRLDRILEAEGDTPNRYKLSKQADVLMLFYLFSPERLALLFERLGYGLSPESWRRTIDYYLARTAHGSTLSYVVHSWVLARARPDEAWARFEEALNSDLSDIQGGTTAEGIHLGAMAGTVDIVQRCFAGLEIRQDGLYIDPALPRQLEELRFRIRYRGQWIDLRINHRLMELTVHEALTDGLPVIVRGERRLLTGGQTYGFALPATAGI